MKKTGKPKTETGWAIERNNGRDRVVVFDNPIEAMEQAKKMYEDDMLKHKEYSDLMRQRRMYEGILKHIDDRLDDYINDEYDLMPDLRVVAEFNNGSKDVLWENGETK